MYNLLKHIIALVPLFFAYNSNSQLLCLGELNVNLDSTGYTYLNSLNIVLNPNPDHTYTLSQSTFTCYDVGHPIVVLVEERTLAGEFINSCWTTVNVHSLFTMSGFNPCAPPIAYCRSEVNVTLNADGEATITPEMISLDLPLNTHYTYSCIPSSFDCSNTGPNEVILLVQGPFSSQYCIMTVNVIDTRKSPPICIYLDLDEFHLTPSEFPFYPDEEILFDASLSYDPRFNKNVKPNFDIYFSENTIVGPRDIRMFSQEIQLKKKTSLNEKIILPSNIKPGVYYIICEMSSSKKQYNIGFKPFVIQIKIGLKPQIINLNQRVNLSQDLKPNMIVFPNPFSTEFTINTTNNGVVLKKITLYDLIGKQLINLSPNEAQFHLSFLKPGIYILESIDMNNNILIHKLIKQ